MSRDLTTAFKNAITAGTVKPVILITAAFDSETLRFWNGTGTLTYDSNDYIGTGKLLTSGPIVETQNIEANGVEFQLSGVPSDLLAVALAEDIHDRTVTQTFVALDTDDTVIADPFTFFSGKADTMDIEEGSKFSTIKLTAESDLIALNRVNERRRTPEDQKLTYPGDTFFDQVAALQALDIVWGANA